MSERLLELEEYRRRMEADLEMAERVHRSMIPRSEMRGNLDVVCNFTPMIGVGGDYATVYFKDDKHVIVTICDVSGHGIAASLLASRVNSFVLNIAPHVQHPCQIIDALNEFVFENFSETGLYLTFFCVLLDLESHYLIHSGCGHPPAMLYSKKKDSIDYLESENTIMGVFKDLSRVCSMIKIPFEIGDRLLLYTDGVVDSRSVEGINLGINGLENYFQDNIQLSTRKCVDTVASQVQMFRNGKPANDDQLMLAISFVDEIFKEEEKMSLQYEIKKMQEEIIPTIPKDALNTIFEATERLVQSGITKQSLKEGDRAPSFSLPNGIEEPVSSIELLRRGPLVVSFYRGGWCPYCNLELRALQHSLTDMKTLGAELVAISPELPDNSLSTIEKTNLTFEVLSDVGNKVARDFGLVFALAEEVRPIYKNFGFDIPLSNGNDSYELPVPATYVIAPDSTIIYSYVDADYTKRAEPKDIIEALKTIAVK